MAADIDILWVTDRAQDHTRFAAALSEFGYAIHFTEPPEKLEEMDSWLQTRVPKRVVLLITDSKDLKFLDHLCDSLRKCAEPRLRFMPVLWAYEEVNYDFFNRIVGIGISHLFSLLQDPFELSSQLKLQTTQTEHVRRLQREIDETARKQATAETAIKQREEFLSVCAHDLRSPVGLVQSSLQMLLTPEHSKPLNDFAKEVLTRCLRQTGNALRLVGDLLDVTSFEQGLKPQYELFNLDRLLKDFHLDHQVEAEDRQIKFHYTNPVSDWLVLGDADRVRQLLQNLLGNALKFTEPGKNIYLNVTSFEGRRSTDPPYPMILISLKDEGKGIPRKEAEKIFDRFSQIKDYSRAGGRGLGLSVAKQISNLHAGNLWVESEEGKGSTFHVLLPHVVSRTKLKTKRGKLRQIVVVEPTESKRKRNFGILEKPGCELSFVKDGVEAVALAFYKQPDVLILRHDMHKMHEAEVAEILHVHQLTSHIQVYLGLESGELAEKSEVREAHIEGVLQIPISEAEFQKQVSPSSPSRNKSSLPKAA